MIKFGISTSTVYRIPPSIDGIEFVAEDGLILDAMEFIEINEFQNTERSKSINRRTHFVPTRIQAQGPKTTRISMSSNLIYLDKRKTNHHGNFP